MFFRQLFLAVLAATLFSAAFAADQQGPFPSDEKRVTWTWPARNAVPACTLELRACPGTPHYVGRVGPVCEFAACPADGPFPESRASVQTTDLTAPRIAVVVGGKMVRAKIGDTVGVGWGSRFADRVNILYSAHSCANASSNAWLASGRLPLSNALGDASYLVIGSELAGCTVELTFTASNVGNMAEPGALDTVRIIIDRWQFFGLGHSPASSDVGELSFWIPTRLNLVNIGTEDIDNIQG